MGYDIWELALKKANIRVEISQVIPNVYVCRVIRGSDIILFEDNCSSTRVQQIVSYFEKKKK